MDATRSNHLSLISLPLLSLSLAGSLLFLLLPCPSTSSGGGSELLKIVTDDLTHTSTKLWFVTKKESDLHDHKERRHHNRPKEIIKQSWTPSLMDAMAIELCDPCDDMDDKSSLPRSRASILLFDISCGKISEINKERTKRTDDPRKLNKKIKEEIEDKERKRPIATITRRKKRFECTRNRVRKIRGVLKKENSSPEDWPNTDNVNELVDEVVVIRSIE
jgi:hypothetical protein